MSRPTCETCRFWEPQGDGSGACRRNSPRAAVMGGPVKTGAVWPLTAFNDWCGEHEPAAAGSDPRQLRIEELEGQVRAMADRIAGQSEALSRAAEVREPPQYVESKPPFGPEDRAGG